MIGAVIVLALMAQSGLGTAPPVPVSLRTVETDRALDEFDATCLAPMFDKDQTAKAIAASTFTYQPEPNFENASIHQQRWRAPEAIVTLTLPFDPRGRGFGIPQCETTMVGREALAPRTLLESTIPHLKHYYPEADIVFDKERPNELTWVDPTSGEIYQVFLPFIASDKPTDSLQIAISIFSPEGLKMIRELAKKENTGAQ